jgi:hypothetical protein
MRGKAMTAAAAMVKRWPFETAEAPEEGDSKLATAAWRRRRRTSTERTRREKQRGRPATWAQSVLHNWQFIPRTPEAQLEYQRFVRLSYEAWVAETALDALKKRFADSVPFDVAM